MLALTLTLTQVFEMVNVLPRDIVEVLRNLCVMKARQAEIFLGLI